MPLAMRALAAAFLAALLAAVGADVDSVADADADVPEDVGVAQQWKPSSEEKSTLPGPQMSSMAPNEILDTVTLLLSN